MKKQEYKPKKLGIIKGTNGQTQEVTEEDLYK